MISSKDYYGWLRYELIIISARSPQTRNYNS